MASQITYADAYDALVADIKAAWTGVNTPTRIYAGAPRTKTDELKVPYAVVRLASVEAGEGTIANEEQVLQFEILGVFDWVANVVLEKEKADRANELAALLMASATFGTDYYLPHIVARRFDENDDPTEPTYEVVTVFEVRRQASYL